MYVSHRILPNYAAESKGLPTLMKSKKTRTLASQHCCLNIQC